MSTELPFDPRPRPDEVEHVLRRVHRRRALRAGGSGAAVVAVFALAALTLGQGTSVLVQENPPVGPATEPSTTPQALPEPSGAPDAAGPAVGPTAGPAAVRPVATPVPILGPRQSPTPRPDDQAEPAPSPAPAQERPPYEGQIGPRYNKYEATDCIVTNRSADDPVIRNDYCLWFISAGSKDSWRPRIRVCRLYDSTSAGRVTFPGGEEADFALYRGSQGTDGRPVVGELLFRFSDTVRYPGGAHGRDVEPGDCWSWQLILAIDFEAYDADAGFVGEWQTRSEQFPAAQRVQRRHFTAGDFHGDNYP